MLHVVKYLRSHLDLAIVLSRTNKLRFYAYTDTSYANQEDSKSTEGSVWYLAGLPIIQATKKQTITANSTTVAKWCALNQPYRDAIWLKKVANLFQLPLYYPKIYTDNINSQLRLSKEGGKLANRWLTLRYFFVKDVVA